MSSKYDVPVPTSQEEHQCTLFLPSASLPAMSKQCFKVVGATVLCVRRTRTQSGQPCRPSWPFVSSQPFRAPTQLRAAELSLAPTSPGTFALACPMKHEGNIATSHTAFTEKKAPGEYCGVQVADVPDSFKHHDAIAQQRRA